jgi:hypothetical protein
MMSANGAFILELGAVRNRYYQLILSVMLTAYGIDPPMKDFFCLSDILLIDHKILVKSMTINPPVHIPPVVLIY